ncbi:hypothetical protein N7495_008092 [Penicillium taxi]|uniref:uncharacterized protein n=1 Tax=Penicillium taxi TaxID=168475 RepID=UPI00254593B4|nr:uncharacterized protein N7495_008092 [Penicillium taxi]KAJ5888051.1 hypothetical protein N7495_008092 [Penicillium taxi]
MQHRRDVLSSPLKRSNTTPTFRSKASQILNEDPDNGDTEDDEETLQLKLAEIQARLKLKQLQKSQNRSENAASPVKSRSFGLAPSLSPRKHTIPRSPTRRQHSDEVQVPVSPTRRPVSFHEPWSPSRYKMGIDKGWRAIDVSLKRPPSLRTDARPSSQLGSRSGAISHSSDIFSPRHQTSTRGEDLTRIKSFSQRMAEGRSVEKSRIERAGRAEKIKANRSSAFQLDHKEIESFKTAAANENDQSQSPMSREPQEMRFNRDDIMKSLGQHRSTSLQGSQKTSKAKKTGDQDGETIENADGADSSKFESYSAQNLSTRILPHSFLSRNLANKTILRIPDLLQKVKSPDFELPEDIEDFVVFGIIASKSAPRQKKESGNTSKKTVDPFDDGLNNTNQYMVMTLTDLKWTIELLLFDTAFPRYYRMTEGTLVAILNPTLMPPQKHKLDTQKFSLALSSSDDKILEIGKSQDIGFCKSIKKSGITCRSWLDGRKTEFCDYHVDIQVRQSQGARAGINKGTGMFGPGGSRTGHYEGNPWQRKESVHKNPTQRKELRPKSGTFDYASQSTVYLAPAPKARGAGRPSYNPHGGSASLLDEDPFIAAGLMGRGMENKEERLRRRLANQQRERDITTKLVSGDSGGVGADYLRARASNVTPLRVENKDKQPGTPKSRFPDGNGMNLASFGRAQNVQLGPPMKRAHDGDRLHESGVKKTRFITPKGIREAGRESLGGPGAIKHRRILSDDDDDDELEFV